MFHSLLIKNANVMDLPTGRVERREIYIENGVIKRISSKIDKNAQYVADADGLIVTAGLVDVHSHLYHNTELIGVDPQRYDLPKGVTYCIDQGSAGADNYADFRDRVIASTDVRVRSFLNCSRIGMPVSSLADTGEEPGPGELAETAYFDRDALMETYRTYADELLGVKVRLTPNICPKRPLETLREVVSVAEELGVRVSVHGNHALGLKAEDILGVLRKGDIFTHTYHDGETGILDEDGNVRECVRRAREKGVIFDTGHGVNSLSFKVMKRAAEQGFFPDTISTDLHNLNINGPVYDMPTTISKFLCCGMPIHEALKRCILNPAELLGLKDKAVCLREGDVADIAAFERKEGLFAYKDAMKVSIEGRYRLEARFTVAGSKLFYGTSS